MEQGRAGARQSDDDDRLLDVLYEDARIACGVGGEEEARGEQSGRGLDRHRGEVLGHLLDVLQQHTKALAKGVVLAPLRASRHPFRFGHELSGKSGQLRKDHHPDPSSHVCDRARRRPEANGTFRRAARRRLGLSPNAPIPKPRSPWSSKLVTAWLITRGAEARSPEMADSRCRG